MDTNYVRLNLPNLITVTLMVYAMTAAVGFGSKLLKGAKANGQGS